jgi:AcrR family transcriptional regulator
MNKASNREEEILTTTGRLFAERGYFGTSMDDIASEVGIGKPALYYYFESKEELCKKLMQKNFLVLKKELRQAVKKNVTPFDTLFQIILVLLDFRIKHPEISLLTSFTGASDEKRPIIRYIAKMRFSVLKLIRELIEDIDITRRRGRKFMYVFSASILGFLFGPFVPKEMKSEELAKQLTRYSLTVR